MLIELGHFALVLAFVVAIAQSILPLLGAQTGHRQLMHSASPLSLVHLSLLVFSFSTLMYAFVTSDFSLKLVVENSHTLKPMLYKVSGVWGNHEGSMLLWVLILALFGGAAALFGNNLPAPLKARVIAVQGSIGVAFLAFILFTSNPFTRLAVPPMNGQDLNPLLQDPGLAFHPPFLYLGYVGLSMTFSFAVAALLEGRVDAAWGRWVRPWTLAAWVFLTIGIGLGSWWAYYELGWGGFWFWDPVENASFMPWLFAAALLHSAIVVEKRESLKAWTILLAILAFGFSLIGTFLVRSGVITSVHAFANDPERGIFILIILGVFMGGALLLFSLRAATMEAKGVFALASRETALVLNNILLAVAAFVVFIGTIWPLFAEAFWDKKLSVGAPFFDAAFTPFFTVLAVVLPVGAMMPWKRARMGATLRKLIPSLILTAAIFALVWVMQTGRTLLGPIGLALGVWLVAGAAQDIISRGGKTFDIKRMMRLPRADWGRLLAHGGLGITIAGVAGLTAWTSEDIRVAQLGESFDVGSYTLKLEAVEQVQGPNYFATQATISLAQKRKFIATLKPEKRSYPVAQMPTTEAGIDSGFWRDVYVVIGDAQSGGGWAVRTYIKPFANWIWGGAIIMSLGGFLSLTDRRYRVAAGARQKQAAGARKKHAVPSQPAAQPDDTGQAT